MVILFHLLVSKTSYGSSGWIAKRNFYEKFGLIHEEGADYNLSIRFTIHIKKLTFV